jgi:hypothetical protein
MQAPRVTVCSVTLTSLCLYAEPQKMDWCFIEILFLVYNLPHGSAFTASRPTQGIFNPPVKADYVFVVLGLMSDKSPVGAIGQLLNLQP